MITRQKARALAERENGINSGSESTFIWPDPPPAEPQKRSFLQSLRALKRSTNTPRTELQAPTIVPESVIPTPSECSELSFCISDHSGFESAVVYEDIEVNDENTPYNDENIETSSENSNLDSESLGSDSSSIDQFSLVLSEDMTDQVSQLCEAVERMRATFSAQPSGTTVKMSVAFPVFRGEECEDVHEFVNNYKRAARLNGWSGVNLALGLPLYLKGHASAWFKTLESPDEMSFDELSAALVHHFASGASEWRVRQALGQRRQLEKESVADYSYSLRTHCARLNLPRTEWTHYFVQGLRPEIREYVVLQQPDNLEAAENFAKLKESVLSSSEKTPAVDAKQISAQIVDELSKAVASKGKQVVAAASGQQGFNVDRTDIKQMIRAEVQQLMSGNQPGSNRFQPQKGPVFQARGFRSRTGDPVCFNCGRRGHTYYNCRADPDPSVARYNRFRRNNFSRQDQGQRKFVRDSQQGN